MTPDPGFAIRGDRIVLRPTRPEDLEDYERWADPSLAAHRFDGPWYGDDFSGVMNMRRKWIEAGDRAAAPWPWLEMDTADGRHIGWVTVYFKSDDPHKTEAGISIMEEDLWERGLGTEAFRLWIDYQFAERRLTRIGFSTWAGNPRMLRVGEKLGFVEEARFRNGCEVEGVFYDRISMGLLRTEWEARRDERS